MGDQTHVHFTNEASKPDIVKVLRLLEGRGYQTTWCTDGMDGYMVFDKDGRPAMISADLRQELEAMTDIVAEVIEK